MELESYSIYFVETEGEMPKIEFIDAANGIIQVSINDKVKRGTYKLDLKAKDGDPIGFDIKVK